MRCKTLGDLIAACHKALGRQRTMTILPRGMRQKMLGRLKRNINGTFEPLFKE